MRVSDFQGHATGECATRTIVEIVTDRDRSDVVCIAFPLGIAPPPRSLPMVH